MRRAWWIVGLVLVVAVVVVLAPLASSDPDGLERVAQDVGFAAAGEAAPFEVLADYRVPFVGDDTGSLILAGIIGVLLVFAGAWALGRRLAHHPSTD